MKSFFKHTAPALALLGLSLGSCKPDLEDSPKSSAGQADFSRYIAVGNSLTAGFGDNGLYLEGQQTSYPAILGQQFALVGGGAFAQPLFAAANSNGTGYLSVTGFTAAGSPVLTPVAANAAVGLGADGRTPLLAKYTATDNQNLGIPGIRVADVQTPGYGFNNPLGFNPYFERLLGATNAVATYQQYVQERVTTIKPTFFTNWLGNNDVLGYATSGGTAAPLTGDTEFTTKYTAVTDVLTAGGANGLLITIPNVVNVPFFTTVTTAAVNASLSAVPVPAAIIAGLTAAPLGLTPAQISSIRFGLYVQALSATGTVVTREATAADLLILPASSVVGSPSITANPFPRGFGIVIPGISPAQAAGVAGAVPPNPLPNALVLDAAEVTLVQNRTTALNTIIATVASNKGLALFDANTFFNGVARNGLVVNGVNNTAAFISGNLFSLDGVHPTPRGYAVIANEMIKAINAKYGSAVAGVDATKYRGVRFPQ